jgi:hypothetical protein
MDGGSRNTGIFQYFNTPGNPLKTRPPDLFQGRLLRAQ